MLLIILETYLYDEHFFKDSPRIKKFIGKCGISFSELFLIWFASSEFIIQLFHFSPILYSYPLRSIHLRKIGMLICPYESYKAKKTEMKGTKPKKITNFKSFKGSLFCNKESNFKILNKTEKKKVLVYLKFFLQ